MRVTRIGLTPVKGGRHRARPWVDLEPDGPVGDRVFCLVDRERGRVLRTVENPALLQASARLEDELLTVTLPGGTTTGVPEPTGEHLDVDYWGRPAAVETVDGPWAEAYSDHLGRDVALARSRRPGEVVYGGSVSLVTTSSLGHLAERVGHPVDSARMRATFTLDTDGEPPHVEDGWVGRRLRLGDAEVEVRGVLPRCAVVDLDPSDGSARTPVLKALADYRRRAGEVVFGVDAVVTAPGRVAVASAGPAGRD